MGDCGIKSNVYMTDHNGRKCWSSPVERAMAACDCLVAMSYEHALPIAIKASDKTARIFDFVAKLGAKVAVLILNRTLLQLLVFILLGVSTVNAADERDWTEEIATPTKTMKPAFLSLDQLRDGAEQSARTLWTLEVDYVQNAHRENLNVAIIPLMRYHFAFKAEKRFRSQWVGHSDHADLVLTFDGKEGQHYLPQADRGTLHASKNGFVDIDAYSKEIGLALTDAERSRAKDSDVFFPSCLNVVGLKWSVLPTLEAVDNADCHVLHSATANQRIWIDPQIGFAVRYREFRYKVDKTPPDQWPQAKCIAFGSFEKVADDTWLPKRVRTTNYVSPRAPKNLWNTVSYRSDINVTKVNVADGVKDDIFRITFPPRTIVNDQVRKRFYRIGDANEELDLAIDHGLSILSKNNVSYWRYFFIALNVVVLVGFGVVLLLRMMSRGWRKIG